VLLGKARITIFTW